MDEAIRNLRQATVLFAVAGVLMALAAAVWLVTLAVLVLR